MKVFEVFDSPRPESWRSPGSAAQASGGDSTLEPDGTPHFDRVSFWRHCLAVGVAGDLLAAAHPNLSDIRPSDAFVCGLLHDLGKLAMDYMLPKSFARVIELTELNQGNIAEMERRVIGLDHHTAGKRLAEQWELPNVLKDCIWLHGSSYDSLPQLPHRRMVGLITLADLLVRRNHIGYSGNFTFTQDQEQLARAIGLNPARVEAISGQLHEELLKRESILGLDEKPSRELFLQSIQQANDVLGRLNAVLDRRSRVAASQAHSLDSITKFLSQSQPGDSVQNAIDNVVVSAVESFGSGHYALLYQSPLTGQTQDPSWLLAQYDAHEDMPVRPRLKYVEPPAGSTQISELHFNESTSLGLMSILPWVGNHLRPGTELWEVKILPLSTGAGTVAVLLHEQKVLPARAQLLAMTTCWGYSIASAGQHDSVRQLGEELAQANLALSEAQERLVRTASLVRLGEMAAGAAHEMNNPLAVISGRSQLLTMSLSPGSKEQQAAQTIFEQSHRLSDLITLLRLFADPPPLNVEPTDVARMLDEVIKRVRRDLPQTGKQKPISLHIKSQLPEVFMDRTQISDAIREVLLNAVQSMPKTSIHVTARVDSEQRYLVMQVSDDGKGMDAYTLSHATDPFFSAKAAGRQIGMGLARVEQLVTGHGGKLELRSTVGAGTTVTLTIPLDSDL